jgi:uncharacterized protein YbaA (DUF1428 family)
MSDPRMAELAKPERIPFDDERLVFGGFQVLVEV